MANPILCLRSGASTRYPDRADSTNQTHREDRWRTYFTWVPRLYILCWGTELIWCCVLVQKHPIFTSDTAFLIFSIGLGSAFATCASHELLHRGTATDVRYARTAMAAVCYGHFVVEHLHHHSSLGKYDSGTVPHKGEAMFAFVLRNIGFGIRNSYLVAERVRLARGKRWLANRVIRQHLSTAAMFAAIALFFGWAGVVVFLYQALLAVVTVEFVQYCEHYGLTRRPAEQAGVQHSWNSNGWFTNAITLNITRHSDHHLNGRIPYQSLRMLDRAPTMPMGYFGLAWLSLVPVLWRRTIDSRLACASSTEYRGSATQTRN